MAKFLTDSPRDIELAGKLLRAGTLVAIPTETVYGLAANAFDEDAVRRIFLAKGRPFIDPLIVHVATFAQAGIVADTANPAAAKLAERFCPGPLTMVLPKKSCVPQIVTAGEPTVAVRMPRHPLTQKIMASAGVPLAAPSANPFGYVSPTTAQHVQDSLGDKIGYIVDGGSCDCGIESTIVLVGEQIRILRLGAITREEISECLGAPVALSRGLMETAAEGARGNDGARPQLAPGMLKKHYSPHAQVCLVDNAEREFPPLFGEVRRSLPREKFAFVFQKRPPKLAGAGGDFASAENVFWLSESGSAADAARAVFALLRKLDAAGYEKIFIEKCRDTGIGAAVNDRLSRAAAK